MVSVSINDDIWEENIGKVLTTKIREKESQIQGSNSPIVNMSITGQINILKEVYKELLGWTYQE